MKERHRREHGIPGVVIEASKGGHEVEHGEIVAVGEPHPLWQAGRAGGVELDHVVVRVRLQPGVGFGRSFGPGVVAPEARPVEAERDEAGLCSERGDRGFREFGDIWADEEKPGPAVLDQAGDFWRREAEVERRERCRATSPG